MPFLPQRFSVAKGNAPAVSAGIQVDGAEGTPGRRDAGQALAVQEFVVPRMFVRSGGLVFKRSYYRADLFFSSPYKNATSAAFSVSLICGNPGIIPFPVRIILFTNPLPRR